MSGIDNSVSMLGGVPIARRARPAWTLPAVALLLAALVALPHALSLGLVNAANQMLIAVLFATAYNVLAGQSGMLAFGHSAYFGIGAFAVIHAMNAFGGRGLLPTPLLPVFGALGGAALGVAAGWFSTKRTGVYFSMITLALAELIHSLAPQLKGVFGGEAGVSSMRMAAWGISFDSDVQVYYLTLAWTVLSLGLLFGFTRTPLGRLALGLRENSHRLRFLGYDVHALKVMVFVISATFAGVAGALLAISNESTNYILFDVTLSSQVVLNAYIGGVGVFLGPALGAALMTFFGYAASDLTRSWLLYQGLLFVVVMMYMPAGLSGLPAWWRIRRRSYSAAQLLPLVAMATAGAVLLVLGVVLTVELLQRIFAQDYQSLRIAGKAWPAVAVMGRDWLPGAASTWLVPAALIAVGIGLVRSASRRWQIDGESGSE